MGAAASLMSMMNGEGHADIEIELGQLFRGSVVREIGLESCGRCTGAVPDK